ncbi:MAG: hypothetical protein ACHQNT_11000 [Bacteroidia bacterium]
MKRKRQYKSPKLSQEPPSILKGDDISILNKKSDVQNENDDSQQFGKQFSKFVDSRIERYLRNQQLVPLPALNNQQPIILPERDIIDKNQALNLRHDISYEIIDFIGCRMPEILNNVYSGFHNNRLTNASLEDFKPHFSGEGVTNARKLLWLREVNLLTFTFEFFTAQNFIPYHKHWHVVIANNFCDSEGKDFDPEYLRKIHSKKVRSIENLNFIRDIFLPIFKRGA